MSFTRRPVSSRLRETSRREDHHIVRNARVQPTASSAAIQAHVAPSLYAHVSSRTIGRRLAEGLLGLWRLLSVLPLTPTQQRLSLEWCNERGTGVQWNGTRSSLATRENPDSISAVMTIVLKCRNPVTNVSILPLLYSNTLLTQLV
ncbi:HTH_Tnp_Tc3_2 domain-containing protein [Trichonephila clavipes]|nr:HTH_Tnp_Tc3_2 domain-containing protein [Trichonephila clavipes]